MSHSPFVERPLHELCENVFVRIVILILQRRKLHIHFLLSRVGLL